MDWMTGPFRTFRDQYVATFGGFSYDLAPGVVAVHPDHLVGVPELEGRDVLISHDHALRGPLHTRPAFTVVACEGIMRDATERAEPGGVVFSTFDLEDARKGRLLAGVHTGEAVYLNAALGRMDGDIIRRLGVGA